MIKRITSSKGIVTAVWVLGLVVIWEICAFIVGATQRTPVNVLPHLYQIIGSFFDTKSITGSGDTIATLVFSSAAETLSRALIGFIIGMVLGYILALLMHLSHIVETIAFPYLMIIQMIPILGMAPIVLSITGDISSARIIIAAILTFYPVSTNTLAGFKSVGRERHELMRSYGASKFQLYTKMLIPSAMSYFFTGLKISAPMAITASILVDTLQGGNGLGCMLSQSLKGSMTRFVFWDIVIFSAVIGVLSFYLMGVIERAITPAKSKEKSTVRKGLIVLERQGNQKHHNNSRSARTVRSIDIHTVADKGSARTVQNGRDNPSAPDKNRLDNRR